MHVQYIAQEVEVHGCMAGIKELTIIYVAALFFTLVANK